MLFKESESEVNPLCLTGCKAILTPSPFVIYNPVGFLSLSVECLLSSFALKGFTSFI